MNFALPDWTLAKLRHVNIRGEVHGDKIVPGFDLAIAITVGNDVLDLFAPGLKAALFNGTAQGTLEGVPGSDAPVLRYAALGPLAWKEESAGYALTVDGGAGVPAIHVPGLKINAFGLKPLDGGSVELDFRCQSTGEQTPDTLGALGALVQRQVRIQLVNAPPLTV
jgi:hypothetical protein